MMGDSDISLQNREAQQSKKPHKVFDSQENVSSNLIRSEIQSISPLCSLRQPNRIVKRSTSTQILTKSQYKQELDKKK